MSDAAAISGVGFTPFSHTSGQTVLELARKVREIDMES